MCSVISRALFVGIKLNLAILVAALVLNILLKAFECKSQHFFACTANEALDCYWARLAC
jgi:hypothetical protein